MRMPRTELQRTTRGVRPASRRAVYTWWMLWMVWLAFMVAPLVELFQSHPSPVRLSLTLLGTAVFFAIYLSVGYYNARNIASITIPTRVTGPVRWLPVFAMTVLAVVLMLADGVQWGSLFVYTCAAVSGYLPIRQALATIAGVVVVLLIIGGLIGATVSQGINAVIVIALTCTATLTVVTSVSATRLLRQQREEMARVAGISEERLRIARDLHDLLGHNLSLITLKSELARRLIEVAPERAAAEIADIERVSRAALQEVREAVAAYRQPTLAGELNNAEVLLAAAGIACSFETDGEAQRELASPLEAALSWAVREGVTNVIRHSRARSCVIRVRHAADSVGVEIVDDGPGSASSAHSVESAPAEAEVSSGHGNGLRGLAERAEALGGTFEAGPLPGSGFRLAITLPQRREAGAEDTAAPVAERPRLVSPVPSAPAASVTDETGEGMAR